MCAALQPQNKGFSLTTHTYTPPSNSSSLQIFISKYLSRPYYFSPDSLSTATLIIRATATATAKARLFTGCRDMGWQGKGRSLSSTEYSILPPPLFSPLLSPHLSSWLCLVWRGLGWSFSCCLQRRRGRFWRWQDEVHQPALGHLHLQGSAAISTCPEWCWLR